jgi:hypothetical protein
LLNRIGPLLCLLVDRGSIEEDQHLNSFLLEEELRAVTGIRYPFGLPQGFINLEQWVTNWNLHCHSNCKGAVLRDDQRIL